MRIFIIARGYPSKQEPTWGCFEKDQAEALASLGHNVTILSVDMRFRFYWRALGCRHIIKNGISIYNIFLLPYALLFFLPKFVKNSFYAWQLDVLYQRAIFQQGTPDILYSHYLHTTQKAIRIHKKYNIPLVGIEHWSQMAFQPISKNNLSIAREVYSSIDQLITVSSSLRKNILTQIGIDSIVIPNIVGNEFYYSSKQINRKTTKIVTVGRLAPEKRFDLLLKALSKIDLPWELNIIGAGKILTELELLTNSLQLTQRVHFLGMKSKIEIVEILQNSHFFVLPSLSETFGVVYIEALACGLPVVSTDCGGPRDIVTPQNGLLIPCENEVALEHALLHMLQHYTQYDRKSIAEDCQARFSPKVIAEQLTQIFENTIKKVKNSQ